MSSPQTKAEKPDNRFGSKQSNDSVRGLKNATSIFMQLPMRALRPESNHYATSAKKGVATGALLALDMAASPFGPSALAIISSATIRPDRVAPSMESK